MVVIDLETKRQSVHLISGVAFASAIYFLPDWAGLLLLGISALFTLFFSVRIDKGKHVKFFSRLVKHTEREGKKAASGVTWYFLGSMSTFVLFYLLLGFPKELIVASMLVVAIGDSLSTGLGRKVGKKRLPFTKTKSYEGTGLGFVGAFIGAYIVLSTILPMEPAVTIAFIGAFAGMMTEAYFRVMDDNFLIPVISLICMIASYWWLGL